MAHDQIHPLSSADDHSGEITDAQHGSRGAGTMHPTASASDPGFMSSADKTKLDGLSGIFGANYQKAESLGRSTTTSTTFQNKATLTTGALTGTYLITWHAVVDQSAVADAVQVQLYNNTDTAVVGVIQEHEPKDVNNRISVGGFAEVVFTGSAKSFIIQYRQQRGNTAGIQDARIMLWRVA